MKIIHVIIGLNVGGAELMLKRLVESLNDYGGMRHSVISLTELGVIGKQLQDLGVNVVSLRMGSVLSLPRALLKLRCELKKQKPDIVQTWMYHADFLGGVAARSLGIKNIIWGIRTTDVTLGRSKVTVILRKLCAWLSYSIPKVIVCAADAGRKEHEQVGYDPSKMRVIPNGFDLGRLKATSEQRAALRKECGFTDEHKVIGSIGRFNPIKNQRAFVEAAALVAKQHDNARFMIVGRDNNWENRELVGWIKQYGLQDKFVLLGERLDVPICLSAMDVFCLHSKTEGFPNILGEAMAMGLPCVSTDVGDAKILISGIGLIVKDSYADISKSIGYFIGLSEYDLFKIAEKSKERIFVNYSISSVSNMYLDVYKSLI